MSSDEPVAAPSDLLTEIDPCAVDEDEAEVDSLPSTDCDSDSDEQDRRDDAEREWRESIEQLELLLSMVLVPFVGKYFGRKCAYWGERCPPAPLR